jgi:3'(2'), 5'-bisphosphate nucleotidase
MFHLKNMRVSVTLKELLPQIVSLSHAAGDAIMKIYSSDDFGTTYKDDNSPLTKADTAAHQLIVKGLKALNPDVPVLSEESKQIDYETREMWSSYWLIDPLDGTKEFLKRNDEFTVNIALIQDGVPVLGVVFAPALDFSYFAAKDADAFRQDGNTEPVPIRVGDYRKGQLKVMITRSHSSPELMEFLKKVGDCEIVSAGSSLKLCRVADGGAHFYPRLGPTMEWDTAAAQCVVEQAGGAVTDLSGDPLRYNKPDLLNPYFMVTGSPPYPWPELL